MKLNVTAICTLDQVREVAAALAGGPPSVISVFAGRIADTGRDPIPLMREALAICRAADRRIELLWASPRELLNIVQAGEIGCDIITVTPDLLDKLALVGKDLGEFSLETVQMFHRDAGGRVQAVSDDFIASYLDETVRAVRALDAAAIEAVARGLARVRDGAGGCSSSAWADRPAHASHAVNDFRKLCAFEAYTPTDNVSELTARVNDEGWDTSFAAWLEVSRLRPRDAVLVFSVGGGNKEKNVSVEPGARAGARGASRAAPCSAWSAATAARRGRRPRRAS